MLYQHHQYIKIHYPALSKRLFSGGQCVVRKHNTGLQKKFPRMNFQYFVSFFPAEYDYESHFFPSRPDFPKFYDKGLKINKICCL